MAAAHGLVSLGIVLPDARRRRARSARAWCSPPAATPRRCSTTSSASPTRSAWRSLGGVAAALVAAPFAPLLSRYRGIFFAMLTLALSMVLYGLLMKLEALGGSDGFNVGRPTLLGQKLARRARRLHALPA